MPDAPIVVVLAGGSNTRFWPLRAKSLLAFCGRTLLERHITSLMEAGCRRFVVVANDETAEEVRAAVAGLAADVLVTVQAKPRGMGDAVLTAAAALPDLERQPFAVTQAHDVVDRSLYMRFVADARAGRADGLLAGQRVRAYFPGGYLILDGNRVVGLVEKPPPGEEPSDVVSMVLHLHRRPDELLDRIRAAYADDAQVPEVGEAAGTANNPATQPGSLSTALGGDDHYERAIAALLPHRRYELVRYDGVWRAVKYPWHVLGVMDLVLRGLERGREGALAGVDGAPTPEGVSGPVVLEPGVRVLPGGRVVGPAWIGAGTLVGTGSLVRGSVVGRHVEIGYGCEIARSYIADGCTFHHNYVGDSVIDRNVGLGFGTVTGNWPFYPPPVRSSVGGARLRTDMDKFGAIVGADSRTGIGVLLNPGVKIGARTFIGPGIIVSRDVPDGRLLLAKQEIRDESNPFRRRKEQGEGRE